MAGKFREVETFVTKQPTNTGADQVHSGYSRKTGEVDTVVTKPLISPGAGQAYSECGSKICRLRFRQLICLTLFLPILTFLQLVAKSEFQVEFCGLVFGS